MFSGLIAWPPLEKINSAPRFSQLPIVLYIKLRLYGFFSVQFGVFISVYYVIIHKTKKHFT